MTQKMLFSFTNIAAEIFQLQILYQAPNFGTFLPDISASKPLKIICPKDAPLWRQTSYKTFKAVIFGFS
jgi:hypothetical protein